jgi:hypothetical protein
MPRRAAISIIVLVCTLLSACTSTPPTTIVPGMAQTLAVRTMVALKGPAILATPTPIPSLTPIPATLNAGSSSNQYQLLIPPTSSPIPSLTPFKALSSWLQNDKQCVDIAEFIKDVTIEDYSQFKPNELFTKVWQVKNVGTCTWTTGYALVFTFGDRMSGISPKYLMKPVQPGDIVDLSIDLVAPREGDIYQGNWMLQDENERQFGTGVAAKDFFWVSIMVGSSGISNLFGGIGGCLKGG